MRSHANHAALAAAVANANRDADRARDQHRHPMETLAFFRVEPGMKVTYKFVGEDDTEVFLLGAREMEDTTDLTVYSPQSPLGQAIIGHKVGETVAYAAPNGKELKVEIVDAKPYTG